MSLFVTLICCCLVFNIISISIFGQVQNQTLVSTTNASTSLPNLTSTFTTATPLFLAATVSGSLLQGSPNNTTSSTSSSGQTTLNSTLASNSVTTQSVQQSSTPTTTLTTGTTLTSSTTSPIIVPSTATNISNTTGVATNTTNTINMRLGFLMANGNWQERRYWGFGQSAPAVELAFQQANLEHLVDNINFTFSWMICDCDRNRGAGEANDLIGMANVDVIIGPPCNTAALYAASIASYYNIPIVTWGTSIATDFAHEAIYPTLIQISSISYGLALATRAVLIQYAWTEVSLVYADDSVQSVCSQSTFPSDFQNSLGEININITITYSKQIDGTSEASVKSALKGLYAYSRIVIACIDDPLQMRNFLIWVNDLSMNTDEWVYIMPKINGFGMKLKSYYNESFLEVWENPMTPGNDGNEAAALATAQKTFMVDIQQQNLTNIELFNVKLLALQGTYPFYCSGDCLGDNNTDFFAAVYALSLYDATLIYLRVLNKTLAKGGSRDDLRNGMLIHNNAPGVYPGLSTTITINPNATWNHYFSVWALNQDQKTTVYQTVVVEGWNYTTYLNYTNEATSVWASRKGVRPMTKPICGYTGDQCPPNLTIYFVIGGAIVLFFLSIALCAIAYALREKALQRQRLNQECFVPWLELRKLEPVVKKASTHTMSSSISDHSNSSASDSAKLLGGNIKLETESHLFVVRDEVHAESSARNSGIDRVILFAQKYPTRVRFSNADLKHLRTVRQMDHDNLNKFIGMCIDGTIFFALWRCCRRGSLKDAIDTKNKYIRDPYIMLSLIRDLVEGLSAIHKSIIGVHGALTSESCLISDRWELKISDFGMGFLRMHQNVPKQKLLWSAPEVLRSGDLIGTPEADIFSFAVICSEFINNELVWNNVRDEKEIDEILRCLQNSSKTLPYRPKLEQNEQINPLLYQLVRDCWIEHPSQRPDVDMVRQSLRQMISSGQQNLMDYVLEMMEQYAVSLEREVDERTRELVSEKKKADILLYRMLPKQVVEKLKIGDSVEPEQFQSATVFFSDIVKFTNLASKCTPLQVVNILNGLYTGLDNIIETFDVYKVETIGDGYLVVSGLPHRNENKHVDEIAKMSFAFMRSVSEFRVEHLPNERVSLRIGFHTGPVVAGVVGLSMPRYCLFGDTVNTASRMESNGKPGHIHVSSSSNYMLTQVIGGYKTESRGEVIIKGKGVMETFWLISHPVLGTVQAITGMAVHHNPEPLFQQSKMHEDVYVAGERTQAPTTEDTDDQMYREYKNKNSGHMEEWS